MVQTEEASSNLKNNRELVMLERSEASTTTAKEKRFFRAKPSTTRLTTYRNDKYAKSTSNVIPNRRSTPVGAKVNPV